MASRVSIVAVLAAAIAAMAFAAERSSARPEFAAEASAAGTKFVSKRYGYELVLVGDYDAYYAPITWTGGFPFGHSRQVDVITGTGDRKFIVAAKRLSTGTTLRKWEASYIATMQSFCEKSRALRNTTLGGVAAREFMIVCPGYDVIAVVALHRGRGYFFQFLSPNANAAASDRRIFDAGRRAFRFTSK